MPVQYTSIIAEHSAVRNNIGIFDVSHMGEILIEGDESGKFIQGVITNDLQKVNNYQALYSPMCFDDGGIVDDLLVYKFSQKKYIIVVNASNIEKDFDWFLKLKKQQHYSNKSLSIKNMSDYYVQIAVQGPDSAQRLKKFVDLDIENIKFYHFSEGKIFDFPAIISRTGYTGEDGFEFYLNNTNGRKVWQSLIDQKIPPCGLGARDTLRLESGLPLYGNDLSATIKPTETIVKWTVKLYKDNFIGKNALTPAAERKMYGFEMINKGIPRHNYEVFKAGKKIGFVTSGSYAPFLKKYIGLTLVNNLNLSPLDFIQIKIRDELKTAQIVKVPFYSKKYKK